MFTHLILSFVLTLIVVGVNISQKKSDFFTMTKGDSVFIFLIDPPKSNEFVFVYRKGPIPVDNEFILLNEENPLSPVLDPEEAKAIIGDEWAMVARALDTDEPFDVLQKLRGSDLASGLLSLISLNVARVTGRIFLDPNTKQNKEYIYKIVFKNSLGKETRSYEKKIKTVEVYPVSPSKLKAKAGDGRVTLSWEYPEWKQNYDDLGLYFDIYRKKADGEFEKINQEFIIRDDATPREYVDLWLENDKEYSYYILAIDPVKRESKPSEIVRVIPKDDFPPAVPTNLFVESGDCVISLTWDISMELDAVGYNVYRSLGLDKSFIKINTELIPLTKPYFLDTSVTGGIQYFYSVSAVDKSKNESKKSNAMSVIALDKSPPDPPKDLTYRIEKRVLNISWKPSEAKDVMGYFVYRGESEEVQPKIVFEPLTSTNFSDSGYQKKGLTPGKVFIVSVTAVDRSRNESPKTTIKVKIPDDEPPLPPEGFIAKNVDGRYVELSCGMSPSLDVEFYKLYRATDRVKETELATFTKTPINFRDTSVELGNRYVYFAVAVDSAKNRSLESRKDTIWFRDFSPPPSPRYVKAKFTDKGVQLEWERVVDFDLLGYNIYRSELPTGVFTKLNNEPVKELKYIDKTGLKQHYYIIKSIDTSGNESLKNEAVHSN